MSYTVLARKWRPQIFEEVVGQRHVTQGLTNALNMGRVAHAFLFSGTRGVGKTTTARVLAKALNCEKGPTATPCGVCDSCKEITQGSSVDVIEIDGASNTGVENVRELRENVKYAPARGKYKVYIIDEVHMLSTAAFNALLKTLEEPPPHVVFIFATTDPHKVPATILSRCQHYDFRRVPKAQIEAHLKYLCGKEGIKAEDKALARLASLAEGSVRDGLSLMDQVVSYCGEEGVREADIDDILGLVGREAVKGAVSAILGQDPARAIEVVAELVDKGHDLRRFSSATLEFLRDLLVARVTPSPEKALDLPEAEALELKGMASSVSPEELIRLMNLFARLVDEMRWSAHLRVALELALVKAASRPISSVADILDGIKGLKGGGYAPAGGSGGHAAGGVSRTQAPRSAGLVKEPSPKEATPDTAYYENTAAARPAGDGSAIDLWDRIRIAIKEMGKAPLASKMKVAAPKKIEDNVLTVVEGYPPFKPDELSLINEAASQTGAGVRVKVVGGNGEKQKTLADLKEERDKSRKDRLKEEAMGHPLVKSALDLFGGEVIEVEEEKTGT